MAVISFKALLATLPPLHSKPHAPPSVLPLSHLTFPQTKPLHLTTPPPPFPLSLSPPRARPFVISAAAAYAVTDDEVGDGEEEEEEAIEGEYKQQRKPPTSSGRGQARLYVGNLPYSMTPSELAQTFGEAGAVDAVEILYDRVTDRSRGFAFVTMATIAEAEEAIRMFDGSQVGGRTLKVNFPEVPRGGEREVVGPRARGGASSWLADSPYKLYAGNLGWTVTSETLREAFAARPGLIGARVVYDRDTGRSRGFGFVSFASEEECRSAMESMDGVEVRGRPLRLSAAARRPSAAAASPSQDDSGMQRDAPEPPPAEAPEATASGGSSLQSSVSF